MKLFSIIFLIFISCSSIKTINDYDLQIARDLVDQATVALREKRYARANSLYKLAYELGELPEALDGQGCVSLMQGDFETAKDLFFKAYKAQNYPHALSNLALLYHMSGNMELAKSIFERAIKEDPHNYRLRNNYSVFLYHYYKQEKPLKVIVEQLEQGDALNSNPLIKSNLKEVHRNLN